jgi:Tfp pilus assembly protein PilV
MSSSIVPAEKLTWKTKMITNKCARATLINARHQAKIVANAQNQLAKVQAKAAKDPKKVHPNTIKWYTNNVANKQTQSDAMAAHFKACTVWAAFNNKESQQYTKKLWKLYLTAQKAYTAARTPANL